MMFTNPSREDAWSLTRDEKVSMTFLTTTVSALAEAKDDLKDRLSKIEGGTELMDRLVADSGKLLTEVRRTIPEKQRVSMANTAKDFEIRLVPKLTPTRTTVVCQKEDFRKLVDAAQIKCRECVEDCDGCKRCDLYQLLTVVLPLDCYEGTMLCPYNMAEWGN